MHRNNGRRQTPKGPNPSPVQEVPDIDPLRRVELVGRHEPPAIRRERDRSWTPLVQSDPEQEGTRGDVPDARPEVVGAGSEQRTARTEGDVINLVLCPTTVVSWYPQ